MHISWHEPSAYAGQVLEVDIPVLYEDDHLALVVKPAGLATNGNQFRTLEHALPHNLTRSSEVGSFALPHPVHRLDLLTSGLLLVAKTFHAHAELARQFEQRSIEKTYTALVHGAPPTAGTLTTPVDDRPARTDFEFLQSWKISEEENLTLISLFPRTGRKHQLRVQLSEAGHPIVGDPIHCPRELRIIRRGMFLNATAIRFTHPVTGTRLAFETAVPGKFRKYPERKALRFRSNSGLD